MRVVLDSARRLRHKRALENEPPMNIATPPAPGRPIRSGSFPIRNRTSRLAPVGVLTALLALAAPAAEPPRPASPPAPTIPPRAEPPAKSLFDGRTLAGWKVTPFGGHGEVEVKNGQILLPMGALLTGVIYTNELPKTRYELSLEAMKVDGNDFFCGLTFPVSNAFCTLILGGWGGGVVGLSSIDGLDASENETTKYMQFEKNRWYSVRLRVMPDRIQAWLDNEPIINQVITGRRISLRPGEIESSVPMGIASYQTTAALRNIQLRSLAPETPQPGGASPTRKP